MSDSTSRIVLAVGLTAIVVSIVLIGGFLAFLYIREPTRFEGLPQNGSPTPRAKRPASVAADEITKISFLESSMSNRSALSPAAYFSNINTSNYSSSSSVVTFSSDGTATKETSNESTINGNKQPPKNERFTGTVDSSAFAALAKVFAENDFSNEPDSRDITSLPIRKVLTIQYKAGQKVINTGHMGRDSPETLAMLAAIKELERKVTWQRVE